MTTAFAPGNRYQLRFIGDSDSTVVFQVVKRTAKFVTINDGRGAIRCGIKTHDGAEYCLPFGSYSMSPALSAEKKVA
jgi:hypothetical protein